MRIVKLETFLTSAGLRNYLFVRLTADNALTGLGEASLEWQEKTVETLIHEWVEDRVLGVDPRDLEKTVAELIRDQYQGGPTVLTAISGVEVALWDLLGKAEGRPVYQLLGGQAREHLPAYANGWYGNSQTPAEYAQRAGEVAARGYRALKFDPFGTAWQTMSAEEMDAAEARVAAVREAVGPEVEIFIEVHGRLSGPTALAMGRRLEKHRPGFYEEPVSPYDLDLLKEVKTALPFPIAAGERLYMIEEFARLTAAAGRGHRPAGPVPLRRAGGGPEDGRLGPGPGHPPGPARLGRPGGPLCRAALRLGHAQRLHAGKLLRVRCPLAERAGLRLGFDRPRRVSLAHGRGAGDRAEPGRLRRPSLSQEQLPLAVG